MRKKKIIKTKKDVFGEKKDVKYKSQVVGKGDPEVDIVDMDSIELILSR